MNVVILDSVNVTLGAALMAGPLLAKSGLEINREYADTIIRPRSTTFLVARYNAVPYASYAEE